MTSLANVTKEVSKIKRAKTTLAEKTRKEEARRNSFAPKTYEERFRIMYPFLFADKKYKTHVSEGDGKNLYFTVGGERFGIWDEFVPAYEGSSDDGYAYAHDSYWRAEIHISNPNEYAVSLGSVGSIGDGDIINSRDTKRSAKDRKDTLQFIADQAEKFELTIAEAVRNHLLRKDDYRYREELRRIGSGRR